MLSLTACPSESHNYDKKKISYCIVASCSVIPKLMGLMKARLYTRLDKLINCCVYLFENFVHHCLPAEVHPWLFSAEVTLWLVMISSHHPIQLSLPRLWALSTLTSLRLTSGMLFKLCHLSSRASCFMTGI